MDQIQSGAIRFARRDLMGLQTLDCPTCGGERGFLLEHYGGYGWSQICLNCGDDWDEGAKQIRSPKELQTMLAHALHVLEFHSDKV